MTFSSILATSSNNNDDISNKNQPQEVQLIESTDNNDQSSDTQSEQNNPCSNETIEGASFIDDIDCPAPCPTLEDQSDDILEGCPVATQTTTTDSQETNSDEDAIKVMTVHASKGMEFPVVFIIDTIESFLLYI